MVRELLSAIAIRAPPQPGAVRRRRYDGDVPGMNYQAPGAPCDNYEHFIFGRGLSARPKRAIPAANQSRQPPSVLGDLLPVVRSPADRREVPGAAVSAQTPDGLPCSVWGPRMAAGWFTGQDLPSRWITDRRTNRRQTVAASLSSSSLFVASRYSWTHRAMTLPISPPW